MLSRIVSGLVLATGIVCVLTLLPAWVFGLIVLFAMAKCLQEYQHITRPDGSTRDRVLQHVALALVVLWPIIQPHVPVYTQGTALFVAFVILAFGRLFDPDPIEESVRRLGVDLLGVAYLGLTLPLVYLLRDRGDFGGWTMVMVMAITFGADTGAFFAGKFLGKHKFYEKISPKKTWEGFFGGLALGVVAAFVARTFFPGHGGLSILDCVVLGAGGATLGALGDLFESMIKRAYGVKDSGTLIPGHGGMLDRVDALLFVGPFALLYLEVAARW